jgi:glycosyltransferase involved in cell wall biosynthesis/RimJ/RimL family protein N-acetyltransferase
MYNVLIRPLEVNDSKTSWKWRNKPEIWEYTVKRPNIEVTYEIERSWIEKAIEDESSKRFAIIVNDLYIGNIQLTNITKNDAQYHVFIGEKSFWGKGISYIASQQLIRFAKNILRLESIYLFVEPNHEKGIKLYQKCGFKIISPEVKMFLNLKENINPTVSIFCMVYNHGSYLKDCLDGFLMQQCKFDFDIVIGEDCSKDNSRQILIDYAKKFPGKFKLILHEKNVGATENQKIVLENCTGKYIAMCEGDDYWTDPYKLQKQVDFLELNLDFSVHYYNTLKLINGNIETESKLESKEFNFFESFAQGKVGPTLTMMFKKDSLLLNYSLLLEMMKGNTLIGDWPLELTCLLNGKGYLDSNVAGVYRVHENGQILTLRRKYKRPRLLSTIYVYTAFLKVGGKRLSKFEKEFAQRKIRRNYFRIFTTEFLPHYYLKFLKDFNVIFFK